MTQKIPGLTGWRLPGTDYVVPPPDERKVAPSAPSKKRPRAEEAVPPEGMPPALKRRVSADKSMSLPPRGVPLSMPTPSPSPTSLPGQAAVSPAAAGLPPGDAPVRQDLRAREALLRQRLVERRLQRASKPAAGDPELSNPLPSFVLSPIPRHPPAPLLTHFGSGLPSPPKTPDPPRPLGFAPVQGAVPARAVPARPPLTPPSSDSDRAASPTLMSPNTEQKVLFGREKLLYGRPTGIVIGAHSADVLQRRDFSLQVQGKNDDESIRVRLAKALPGHRWSKSKFSTLFPSGWPPPQILRNIRKAAKLPPVAVRPRDGTSLHQAEIDGVKVEVIKKHGKITAGYPAGDRFMPVRLFLR